MLNKNATFGDIHTMVNWQVANAAAKTALTLASTDVGKICYQQDNGAFYILLDDSPVTWYAINFEQIVIAFSNESDAISAGTDKVKIPVLYSFYVVAAHVFLSTAQASGSIFTVDVNDDGASILSTRITVDNTENTSVTATTAPVLSANLIAANSVISIDVDAIGDGTAKGGKVILVGFWATSPQ